MIVVLAERNTGFGVTYLDDDNNHLVDIAFILMLRLERLSAYSSWAHRASGVRGSLLKQLDEINCIRAIGDDSQIIMGKDLSRLRELVEIGFVFLEKAARAY
jgi:hypothetical protein